MTKVYSLSIGGSLMAKLLKCPVDISFRDEVLGLMYELCRKNKTREIILEQDFMILADMIMDFKAKYDCAMTEHLSTKNIKRNIILRIAKNTYSDQS